MIQNFQEQNFKGKSNTHKSVQRTIFFQGFHFMEKIYKNNFFLQIFREWQTLVKDPGHNLYR